MKAILTVGIPASGKSTKYAQKVDGVKYYVINRDDIRQRLFQEGNKYSLSRKKEDEVTVDQYKLIEFATQKEWNIALTDTWLNISKRENMISYLESLGYCVELDIIECSYELAVKRDLQRDRSVGSDVIWRFHKKWHEQFGIQKVDQNMALDGCYIFDIDGTLAKMNGRSPFDWHRVGEDLTNCDVWRIASMIGQLGYKIIVMSGRDSVCRKETEAWLEKVGLGHCDLYMRPEGSQEKDFEVKLALFDREVRDKYKVLGVFDDRPQVCRLWNLLGLPLFKVGDQQEF